MKLLSKIWETFQFLLVTFLIALSIDSFIIVNARVPSASMESTIMTGSHIIGDRVTCYFTSPKRGDIMIFKYSKACIACGVHNEFEKDTCAGCKRSLALYIPIYYIKRTIGVPGDHVELRKSDKLQGQATLIINGKVLYEPYLNNGMLYIEDLTYDVPEGEYFFLGDNRDNSLDSRFWQDPFIEKDRIIAKARFVYFPIFSSLN